MPDPPDDESIQRQKVTFKFRLRDKHAAELNRQAQIVNFVWNYCNETSQKAWRDHRRWLSDYDLRKLTAGSSAELNISSGTIGRVCGQFAIARDKVRRPKLRWRSPKSLGWVPFKTETISFDGNVFKFRGSIYRTMHLRDELRQGVKIASGSFNADSRGRWYLNICVAVKTSNEAINGRIGIDLGLHDLATLSDGMKIAAPRFYRASEAILATAQRHKKKKRVKAIHANIANRRKDFLHKASAKIAKEYGLIIVGDVSPKKLARTIVAKGVLDAGWSDFRRMLSYKAIRHGGSMREVSEHLSTQTCSECGTLPSSRPKGIAGLSKRVWQCDDCGTVHDRDVNAARNILRIGMDTLLGGTHA